MNAWLCCNWSCSCTKTAGACYRICINRSSTCVTHQNRWHSILAYLQLVKPGQYAVHLLMICRAALLASQELQHPLCCGQVPINACQLGVPLQQKADILSIVARVLEVAQVWCLHINIRARSDQLQVVLPPARHTACIAMTHSKLLCSPECPCA